MFKKIIDWFCSFCSRDEISQINEQKKVIGNLIDENNSLKARITQMSEITEDLTASNKILKEQVEKLQKEVNINFDKASKFDIITNFVDENILNQLIEQAII